MKIGFIGLGRMGQGMATKLLAAGHEVTVYNRTPEKMRPLVEKGAQAAEDVSAACRGNAVITMLANDGAVEGVALGDGGIAGSLGTGAIHISMSTISVDLSERLVRAHEDASQRFLSAPVFGRPEAAASGNLFIIAGGKSDAVEECASLFDALGQKTFHFNTPPAANLIKLSGNFLIASIIESLGEVMALVGKAGIDKGQYVDLLTSTLFNAPVFKTYGGVISQQKYEPAGFAAPLGLKDINLALAAADKLNVPMPVANLLHERFTRLLKEGGEALDWSAIALLSEKDAGAND